MTELRRRARTLAPAALFAALDAVLWNEREALEHVLFRLVEEHLVVDGRARRWLGKADDDLRAALRDLDTCADIRGDAVLDLAEALGVRPSCTLATLTELAPAPWPAVFAEHRQALRVLFADLDAALAAIRPVLQASAPASSDSGLELLVAEVHLHSAAGTMIGASRPALAQFLA